MTPAARRDAIVDAALAVALRKGLGATTVRDVAAELHCSSGLIHHYFTSMDDVLAAAFERAAGHDLAEAEAAVAAEDASGDAAEHAAGAGTTGTTSAHRKLGTFFGTYTRADSDWAYQLWLDAWAEAVRRPAIGDISRQLNAAWQQLLVRIIREGVVVGTFRCADPDATAWRLLSLIDGLSLQAVAHRGLVNRATMVEWTLAAAEDELGIHRTALPRR